MLHQQQKVKWAVLNAPFLIEEYKKPPYNKAITNSVLGRMLNRSCGIEIECFGSLSREFIGVISNSHPMQAIAAYYNLLDYYEESSRVYTEDNEGFNCYNEHKIRIKDHSQLVGLYEILNDMKKYCTLNPGSGIHIHIDVDDVFSTMSLMQIYHLFNSQLEPKLDEIEQIFYPGSTYAGQYNERGIGTTKDYWVAIRFSFHTLEFRIAPMTFEYNTIVTWLVKLNKLVNQCILQGLPDLFKTCNVRHKVKNLLR